MIESGSDGRIRTVTFDRPERRNALTSGALETLESTITAADEPVVVLEGNGSAFCAGADLSVVGDLDREQAAAFARRGQRVAQAIEESSAIVIAAIDGAVRGGGLELALACDIRVGTQDATVGEPGVTFGLFGAWGGTVRLPRIVGEGNALELVLSGRVLDADEALRIGLLSRIEPEPRVVAEEIAGNPADTLTVLKRRIRDDGERSRQERSEAEAFADLLEAHAADVRAALD